MGTSASLETYKKFISSPHRPISSPQTPTTKIVTIRQQHSNLKKRQQTKPRYLVPPDLLHPSGYYMDQSDKCRVFPTWHGLTSKLITKHLPPSVNNSLGHLRQKYQNTRSTKKIEVPIQPPILHQKTNNAFLSFQPTNTIFSDQTGAFPIISIQGYRYIMLVYIYGINAILMRCLKTKTGAEHLQTLKDIHTLLLHRGLQPKYCRMENECSAPIKKIITDNNMELQLTPPQMHIRNWSERSIQTGKAHLIAGLVGINPKFPLHLWCRLCYNGIIRDRIIPLYIIMG